MRIAIISDIHANLEALESVLLRIETLNIQRIICLGDIVGYGADPNACVELIREKCFFSLMGNHDNAALGKLDISYFNPYAKNSVKWTENILSEDNKNYLAAQPLQQINNGNFYVHSTPYNPEEWNYIFTVYDAKVNFNYFRQKLCFIGHSHQPVFILLNHKGDIFVRNNPILPIEDEFRYIINVGSVGQPRDGNPASAFVVYDEEENQLELIRQPYDIEKTQQKMEEADIHPFLIERLAHGR